MGPPPRSFAADAHACLMVQVPHGATEYKVKIGEKCEEVPL